MGLDVLKGMINILKNCNPIVCIELLEQVEKTEQIHFMNKLGYEVVDIIIKEHVFRKIKN